jgi:hypothetical protein
VEPVDYELFGEGHRTEQVTRSILGRDTFWSPGSISVFGVLQLRVYRFGRLHFEVLASKVQHLHILQDGVCALFIL